MVHKGLRGQDVNLPAGGEKIGIPSRVFLFTMDQLSVMLDIDEKTILSSYIYFEGRSVGSRKKGLMVAINIAPPELKPEWRVAEREFIRWMRVKGYRYYERGVFT
jgi:hypothetical protein